MGLLYKKEIPINYCPKCKTGLAEEEVLPDGTHERCGTPIIKKKLPQWIFRITKYADRLLSDLEGLDWPEGILQMQKNWIGRSEGAEVKFKIQNSKFKVNEITVFTTRPDTIYGVTALVLAPEHQLVEEILTVQNLPNYKEIKDYVEKAKRKLDLIRTDLSKEKTGVFTGFYAQHPLTGEKIPIWIADYVLGWYGGGAVMVVPAHDERDFDFAKKFNLPIKTVVKPLNIVDDGREKKGQKTAAFTDYGILINSEEFTGLTSQEAIKKITEKLEKLNLGKKAVSYKLRDWIFSRQRYWGEPIPMVYCQKCAQRKISYWDTAEGKNFLRDKNLEIKNSELKIKELYGWFPVSESELPIKLPYVKSYQPTETGQSPLSKIDSFVCTRCPNCGNPAYRETDTMPNWAGSCWYFLAFAFADKLTANDQNLKSLEFKNSHLFKIWNLEFINSIKYWLPVDWYLGGAEHAVLHLLYSRFWVKALQDLKLLNFSEPFLRLRSVGMVLAEDHRKMSKSFGNVINPDDVVLEYGADTLRIYEMFMAPFSSEIAWSTKALQGGYRFLARVWQIYQQFNKSTNNQYKEDKDLVIKLKKTILKVSSDIVNVKFNTAIASMMEFLNEWERVLGVRGYGLGRGNAKQFLQLLAPFAPFITEEIWREVFGEKKSIHLSSWPEVKGEIKEEELIIPVQVNGKLRGMIKMKREHCKVKQEIVKKALENEKVKKYLEGRNYRIIYIEGRVLNFVVK